MADLYVRSLGYAAYLIEGTSITRSRTQAGGFKLIGKQDSWLFAFAGRQQSMGRRQVTGIHKFTGRLAGLGG